MTEQLRILSVGAHPADVFDQCGGTLAHHVERGDRVTCVVLTHGARIHDKVISDSMFHRDHVPEGETLDPMMTERSDFKANEVRAACKVLGVEDVRFFGADDGILLVTDDAVRKLARLLRDIQPDIVLTHFPKEGDGLTNQHAVAGQIVLHAIQFACGVDGKDANPPHRVAQVFFFGLGAATVRGTVWDSEGGYYNNVFINITDVIDKKLAALDCMVSQAYAGAYARKRIETGDGTFGGPAECAYAEGFISMRAETHHYLPLSEHRLKVGRSSDHEVMNMYTYRIPVDRNTN